MKKFLFAALAVLMLTAVCIVGMFTVLSQDGTVAAAVDELDAVGAGAVAVTAGACDDGAHDYSVVTPIEEGDYANYYHQSVCSLCGAVAPGVPVPHSFGVWKYDDTAHWLECACGVKQSDIFPTITPVAHDTYIDTDDWHTDGDNHWNECVCGYKANLEAHIGGSATCLEEATCTTCDASYGGVNGGVHVDGGYWEQTETTHQGIYKCCGLVVDVTDHVWGEDHICDICEYECQHTGGEATCVAVAICDWCGKGYGQINPDNHHGGTATCVAEAECTDCGQPYGEKNLENHTSPDFYYEVNGTDATKHDKKHTCCNQVAETVGHTGGTATCNTLAVCEHCGTSYGSYNETNHAEGYTITWTVTVTTHTGDYSCCDAIVAETEHDWNGDSTCDTCEYVCANHVGGTATCKTLAVCDYCDMSYGELDADNHESAEYNYAAIINNDSSTTQHSRTHQCCNAPAENEDHTVGEAANCQSGAICEYCEAEYTAKDMTVHTEATFTYEVIPGEAGALSTQHKKIHTCCGEFVAEDHTGGEAANCQTGSICAYCQTVYTAKDMTVHTEATFRYEVIPGEGGALSTQHRKIHTCCGEFVAEVHTGGVANCQSGARCEYCQEVYTGLNATKHTSTEYTYAPLLNSDNTTTQHTKNYQCCGVVAATESHSGGIANCLEKAVCTNCGTAYGSKDETVHKTPDAFEYAITETQHTKLYACCDAPAAETEDHDFVNGSCSVCDAACAHTDGQFAYTVNADDENQHDKFYQCCGLVVETVSHAFGEDLYNQDSAQHWYLCVCGATNGAEDHAWELKPVANDPDHHHMICTCGNVQADSTAEHTFDAYDKNGTFHWSICACGESAPDAQDIAHVYDLHKHDDENHWSECICGQIDAGSVVAHVLVKDWDEGSHWDSCEDANCNYTANAEEHIYSNLAAGKDAQGHWDECDCGAPNPLSLAEHEWEDGACEICQYTCVHGTADDHEFCVNADDNSKHDEICMLCREVLNTVDHDFTGDVYVSDGEHHWIACADCLVKEDPEAGEAHDTTSEATCNSQAVCSVCGEYGDFDGDNHATEDVKFMPIPGDLKQHAQLHACCDVLIQKMDHTYEDGVCTTEGCEYTCTHTGGTATCKDKAVCTACGEAYGELATEHKYDNACDTKCNVCDAEREITHSYGEWTVTKEATETEAGEKKRTCSICGATQTEEIAALGKQGLGTGAIVGIVAGSVVVVGAGVGIGVAAAKRGAAAKKAAADQKPWRTKKNKKSKWKKK